MLVKQESVKATGHKAVTDEAVAATCETDGKTEGSHCSVCGKVLTEQKTIPAFGHTWDTGKITKEAACETKGVKTYTCETCKKTRTEEFPALVHKFGEWVTTSRADVLSPAKQTRTCTTCGKKEQRNYGSRLRGTMTVNVSSIPLKTRQKTSVLKVTGLARGDSITSWKSSNTKVAAVNSKGVVTAKAKGSAVITASCGEYKVTCKITVKNPSLKLTKSSATVKVGKTTKISAKATPSGKVTYKSSNSKIATVSSKGVVKGKKKGTAKITVTCNGVTKTVKVTVK